MVPWIRGLHRITSQLNNDKWEDGTKLGQAWSSGGTSYICSLLYNCRPIYQPYVASVDFYSQKYENPGGFTVEKLSDFVYCRIFHKRIFLFSHFCWRENTKIYCRTFRAEVKSCDREGGREGGRDGDMLLPKITGET